MTHLIFSPAAQSDIDGIYDFTAENWSVAQAERYTRDLRDTCYGLSEGKRQGREVDHIRRGYWRIAAGSNFIFNRQSAAGIEIMRVLHHRMDLGSHLQQI